MKPRDRSYKERTFAPYEARGLVGLILPFRHGVFKQGKEEKK